MPGTSVVFHRLAAREYRSARQWYADRSAEVAEEINAATPRRPQRQHFLNFLPLPHGQGSLRPTR